jgi:beta-galactosidase
LSNDPITIDLEGPAVLLGSPLLALSGGTSAIWVKTTEQSGHIRVVATHPVFGRREIILQSEAPRTLGL